VNPEAFSEEPSGNDAGVVEDDQFFPGEEVREPGEFCVREASVRAFDDEEARGVAAVERALGDQVEG